MAWRLGGAGEGSQGAGGNLRGSGCAHSLDCGDGFVSVSRCENLSDCVFTRGRSLSCVNYSSIEVAEKKVFLGHSSPSIC